MRVARFVSSALLLAAIVAQAQQPAASAPKASGSRQMQQADLKAWKTIRQSVLSPDGKWFAYGIAPNEGDATVVIRETAGSGKETKYAVGNAGGGRGGPPE